VVLALKLGVQRLRHQQAGIADKLTLPVEGRHVLIDEVMKTPYKPQQSGRREATMRVLVSLPLDGTRVLGAYSISSNSRWWVCKKASRLRRYAVSASVRLGMPAISGRARPAPATDGLDNAAALRSLALSSSGAGSLRAAALQLVEDESLHGRDE
jgi:hypothetical protein